MLRDAWVVLAVGRSRRVDRALALSLLLGVAGGGASVGLLALSGWYIAMSAVAGAGLAAGFSFFYPSAGVQALAFARTILRYAERLIGHRGALRLDAAFKEQVFAAAVTSVGRGRRTGELLHAATSDAEIAETSLLRVLAPVVTYAGVCAGGCGVLAALNVVLAAVVAAGVVLMAAAVILPGWLASLRPGRVLAEAESRARQELVDALDGLDELISFDATSLAATRADGALASVETAQRRLRTLSADARTLSTGVAGATILLVAALASGSIGTDRVAVATAAAVTLTALGMLQLSDPVATAAREVGRARTVWARLAETLSEPGQAGGARAGTGPEAGTGLPGSIAVRGLRIDRGRGPIVDRLALAAAPGQTVLVTGRSGAGKSSLLAVLGGELAAASGTVRVAGKTVMLPQHPYVFRGTVADNLRIADPDASAGLLGELTAAVGLGGGGVAMLGQRVGAGGRTLSGGQSRRLAVARALAARPAVLLADEPTEGLDADAASELLLTLRLSDPRMTLVIVLHDQQVSQLGWEPDTIIDLGQQP